MSDQFQLTEEEQGTLAGMREGLLSCGYRDLAEYGELRVGARIRHHGHQWSEAYRLGTGYVVALLEKPGSAWSRDYRMPDIELVAVWDKSGPFGSSRLSQLAQYHVSVIEVVEDAA